MLLNYVDQLVRPMYNSVVGLTWSDTGNDSSKLFKTFIMELACQAGLPNCVDTAGEKFLGLDI